MRNLSNKRRCQGLTLVELMIALALSLLVMGAAISVFMGTKEAFRLEEDISAVQENYRFIADRFKKDFSMVGFSGCAMPFMDNSPTIQTNLSGAGNLQPIEGTEGGGDGTPDAINVSYAELETGIPVLPGMADLDSPLPVSKDLALYQALIENFTSSSPVPVILMVGNCQWGDLFLVTGVSDGTLDEASVGNILHDDVTVIGGVSNTSTKFSDIYGRNDNQTASVYMRTDVTYEVDTVEGVTGLYETRNGGTKQLVLDNVTNMQILYGTDSVSSRDGNADNYQAWDDSLIVSNITSLQVTLTMVVTQQSGKDVPRDYSFNIKLRDMGLDL
jgi:type IV pilus assembly protein PilW